MTLRSLPLLLFLSVLLANAIAFQCTQRKSRTTTSSRTLLSASGPTIPTSEISILFHLLRDTTVLYDPSRGTCCRNKCSGCTYLDSNGNFDYDEYTQEDDGGWIAPYVKVDFGEKVHVSAWSALLFHERNELERDELASIVSQADVSEMAIHALWVSLSPSAGYPRLTSTEVLRAIKGMDGADSEMGGAVDYASFHKAMLLAVSSVDVEAIDYDAMDKEALLELCLERGMKTNFPKMKRIIIEELRFFDANGRQGKRHPTKNTLQ